MTQFVKPAQLSDTSTVSAILQEAAAWCVAQGEPLWKGDELAPEKLEADVRAGLFHLVCEGETPVAVFKLQWSDPLFWPDVPQDEAAYVHRLAVKRSHAGQGITNLILKWAADQARAKKLKYLRLDTEAKRKKLCAVYEKFGFKRHSERQVGPYWVARFEYEV